MASAPNNTGNCDLFSRSDATTIMARALGRAMRSQKQTTEKLARLTGIPERRIESYRSFSEDAPVTLEDLLAIAEVLRAPFLTGLFSEIDIYAAEFNGASPEKIGAQIMELANKLTGGDGK